MARYRFIKTGNFVDFYDQSMHVIKLHDTSRCITWIFDNTPGINFKIDEMIYHSDLMSDISFNDVACSAQADFKTGILAMFPDMAGGGGAADGNGIYDGSGTLSEDTDIELDGKAIAIKEGVVTRFGVFPTNSIMKSPDGNTSIRIDDGTIQAENIPAAEDMTDKEVMVWDITSAEVQHIPAADLGIGGGINDVLLSELVNLINEDGLTPGKQYNITNGDSLAPLGVILTATSENTLSNSGLGGFLNPDYQQEGDYSDVTGYTQYQGTDANAGVWIVAKEADLENGNVVISGGVHYKVIDSGAFDGTPPSDNTDAYEALTINITNGFIEEWNFILYQINLSVPEGFVSRRIDTRFNDICDQLSQFQWGNDDCTANTLIGNGRITNKDSIGKVERNTVVNGELDATFFTGECNMNLITDDATLDLGGASGGIIRNTIKNHSQVNLRNSDFNFQYNQFSNDASMLGENSVKANDAEFNKNTVTENSVINLGGKVLGASVLYNAVANMSSLILTDDISGSPIQSNSIETGSTVNVEGAITAFTKNKFWLGYNDSIANPNLTGQLNGVAP